MSYGYIVSYISFLLLEKSGLCEYLYIDNLLTVNICVNCSYYTALPASNFFY